jgi:hypothetical protein
MPFSLASMATGVIHYPDRLMPVATRAIVTSQPDVACDVCGRRLLRGEQPDVFLAGGERRTVCELCAPRAMQEGWLRETGERLLGEIAEPRERRRGRGLFKRLRWREPLDAAPEDGESQAHGFREDFPAAPAEEVPSAGSAAAEAVPAATAEREPGRFGSAHPLPAEPESGSELEDALQAFNAGEHPRRVAGVARSLGAPSVSVVLADATATIVVAWELCWYRYEVDLGDELAGARVVAQGTELGELASQERRANALADERGRLSLTGA